MSILNRMCWAAALFFHPARGARLVSSNKVERCWDTDNGLVNEEGWGCEIYQSSPEFCGKHDGNGFLSMDMCCACNGGYREESAEDADPCQGYTCDQWIQWYPTYTCSYLAESFGCDCSTSSCTTNCPATCNGYTCDEVIASDHSYTCGLLQHSYGCDCYGCECKAHELALTDGYTLLTSEQTGMSGDCMMHCIGCDHTWIHRNVHSIQRCRTLCDENFNDAGVAKWCYAYSWDEQWSTCRLYHEVPDGPSNKLIDETWCYVKAVPPVEENDVSAQRHIVDATNEAEKQVPTTTAHAPMDKTAADQPKSTHQLGLVNANLWAHYAMTASLTFKITNTFSDPATCVKSHDACISSNHFDHADVLTFEERDKGAYSRHTIVLGGGAFGTSQKYALFKPNVVNLQTTWRVADVGNDENIHFTIQKIKGDVDCKSMSMFRCKKAWNVYRGRAHDNIVAYYARRAKGTFSVYTSRAAFEAHADDWSAAVKSILPTESNGQSVLSVTIRPGEDTALLLLTAWAMHNAGEV